ncbi:hypothetical protein KUCAC02_020580, partial [Chaenocephalus aceratus]
KPSTSQRPFDPGTDSEVTSSNSGSSSEHVCLPEFKVSPDFVLALVVYHVSRSRKQVRRTPDETAPAGLIMNLCCEYPQICQLTCRGLFDFVDPFEKFSLDSPGCKLKDADWSEVSVGYVQRYKSSLKSAAARAKARNGKEEEKARVGPSPAIDRND